MRRNLLFSLALLLAGVASAFAEKVKITYTVYDLSGYVAFVEEHMCEVGDPYPPIDNLPDFVDAMTPTETVDVACNVIIPTQLAQNFPFKLTFSYSNATWYFVTVGGKYMKYNKDTKRFDLLDAIDYDDAEGLQYCAWTFVGEPFTGFQVMNKGVGENAYPVMPLADDEYEAGSVWDLHTYPVDKSAFTFTETGTSDYLTVGGKSALKIEDATEWVKYDLTHATFMPSFTPANGSTVAQLAEVRLTFDDYPGMIDNENPYCLYDSENKKVADLFVDYDEDDDYVIWVKFGKGEYEDFTFKTVTQDGTYHFSIPTAIIWDQGYDMWAKDEGISAGATFNKRFTYTFTVDSTIGIEAINNEQLAINNEQFNLLGQKVNKVKGVVIQNGKKIVR